MASGALQQAAGQAAQRRRGRRTLTESLYEYGRGIAGGLIFCLPLIYTQEVWELGRSMGPVRLGVGLVAGFLLLLGYNRYAGLRYDASIAEVLIDSVEELGLGLLIALALLWLTGELRPESGQGALLGPVVLEGILAAIGVSVGTAQLGGDDDEEGEGDEPADAGLVGLLALGVCGAVLIAANVAPTEEIALIAARSDPPRLLALAGLTLALTAMICFYSDFSGARRPQRPGPLEVTRETAITYAVALSVAAGLLWFFGHLAGLGLLPAVARIVVLSVPAALGASAGRLLLQPK